MLASISYPQQRFVRLLYILIYGESFQFFCILSLRNFCNVILLRQLERDFFVMNILPWQQHNTEVASKSTQQKIDEENIY